MGVDAADFDGDGWQDLFVANVDQEMFSLYQNDATRPSATSPHANGVAQATRLLSGWGLKFFDYDNDGSVDLFLANGHPDDMIEKYSHAGEIQGAAAAVPPRGRRSCANVSARRGPGLHQDVPGARPRRRRLRQRRPPRRPDRQQRRRAGPAAQPRRRGQPLARAQAAGRRRAIATRSARGSRWSAGGVVERG